MFGCRLPSPAWNTFERRRPWRSQISQTRARISGSFVRGHDRVVHVEVGREAAHRAEGALARPPEARALGVVAGDLDARGAGRGGELPHARHLARDRRPHAVELDQQHRAGVGREPRGVDARLDGADRALVDDLERRGHEAGADDRRHRPARGHDVGEDREQRLDRLGDRHEAHPDARRRRRACPRSRRRRRRGRDPARSPPASRAARARRPAARARGRARGSSSCRTSGCAARPSSRRRCRRSCRRPGSRDRARRRGRARRPRARARRSRRRAARPRSGPSACTSRIRSMREHSITTPPSAATAPPESPVPAPRGHEGHARVAAGAHHRDHLLGRPRQHDGVGQVRPRASARRPRRRAAPRAAPARRPARGSRAASRRARARPRRQARPMRSRSSSSRPR